MLVKTSKLEITPPNAELRGAEPIAQGPVDGLVGRLRAHAEAHEYIANADPEQKQWMNDLYDAADEIEAIRACLNNGAVLEAAIEAAHEAAKELRAELERACSGSPELARRYIHGA